LIERRKFLLGLGASLITAPAIVRAASLMPVRALAPDTALRWTLASANTIGTVWYALDDNNLLVACVEGKMPVRVESRTFRQLNVRPLTMTPGSSETKVYAYQAEPEAVDGGALSHPRRARKRSDSARGPLA